MILARLSKSYDLHLRLDEEDAARWLALVERLQVPQSDVAREAVAFFLSVAETAPSHLSPKKLAAWLEDAAIVIVQPASVGLVPPPPMGSPPPPLNGHRTQAPTQPEPTRAVTARKVHKRS